jgi:hypothetical protein
LANDPVQRVAYGVSANIEPFGTSAAGAEAATILWRKSQVRK